MTPAGFFLDHLWLIPLFPLIAAMVLFVLGRQLPTSAISLFGVGSAALSFSFAAGAVFQLLAAPPSHRVYQQIIFEWVAPGAMPFAGGLTNYSADWGYLLDPLSSVMLLLASGVGLLAHVYSLGSMRREAGYHRYFASLNLFMFSRPTTCSSSLPGGRVSHSAVTC
jgi:NADH-quinone oxidoreductase subunit L